MDLDNMFDNSNVNALNSRGQTRLIAAAESGDFIAVRKLINKGADISIQDKSKTTARVTAMRNGNTQISDFLFMLEKKQGLTEPELINQAQLTFQTSKEVKKLKVQKATVLAEREKQEKEDVIWFYSSDLDIQEGPVSYIDLKVLLKNQSINEETLIWSPQLDDWKALRKVMVSAESEQAQQTAPDDVNDAPALNYMPIFEFSALMSLPEKMVKDLIDDGTYEGKLVDGEWFVREGNSENEQGESNTGKQLIRASRKRSRKALKGKLSGVGGWLLFLVICLMILGPLSSYGSFLREVRIFEEAYPSAIYNTLWLSYKTTAGSWVSIFVAISFFGGWGLAIGSDRKVVKSVIIILWIIFPLATLVLGGVVPRVMMGEEFVALFAGKMIGSVIWASIWTAYLMKSKRVRNTYG